MKRKSLGLVGLLALTGCVGGDGDGDGDGGSSSPAAAPTAFYVTPAQVSSQGATATFDAAELRTEINDEDGFYDKRPKESGASGGDSKNDCANELINDSKIEAAGDSMSISASIDASECFLDSGLGAGLKISFQARLFVEARCEGGDLSALNGQSLTDLGGGPLDLDPACADALELRFHADGHFKLSGTLDFGGMALMIDSEEEFFSTLETAEGGPCQMTKADEEVTYDNGCLERDRKKNLRDKQNGMASPDEGKITYSELRGVDLVGGVADERPYFKSGTKAFKLANWTGVMTYTGENVRPTWTATDGTNTETGEFGTHGTSMQSLKSAQRSMQRALTLEVRRLFDRR